MCNETCPTHEPTPLTVDELGEINLPAHQSMKDDKRKNVIECTARINFVIIMHSNHYFLLSNVSLGTENTPVFTDC